MHIRVSILATAEYIRINCAYCDRFYLSLIDQLCNGYYSVK